MALLDDYLERQLARGKAYFTREEALRALRFAPESLTAALSRLVRKHRIANPRHGFFLILRPEDRPAGAPDPVRWIDPLMKYQRIDYRVSLLSAAALHGASHQAAMVFQVVVPRQLRDFALGRHRLEFITQAPHAFAKANRPEWLAQMKTDAGYAKAAGIELTLLDCARYFHRAGGISAVAQIAKDLGAKARARGLAELARAYENSAVRRLGYLLELAGHERQARALEPFAGEAKSVKLLDPSSRVAPGETSGRWKIAINGPVEFDS
jgi:predicted transcriptional regulator of viral defense system